MIKMHCITLAFLGNGEELNWLHGTYCPRVPTMKRNQIDW